MFSLKYLSNKIAFIFLIIYGFSAFLIATVAYRVVHSSLHQEFVLRGEELTRAIARQSVSLYEEEDIVQMVSVLQNFEGAKRVLAVIAYDKKGEVWLEASSKEFTPEQKALPAQAKTTASWNKPQRFNKKTSVWEFVEAIQPDPKAAAVGWVRMVADKTPLEQAIANLLQQIIWFCVGVTFIGLVIMVWVIRRALRPVPALLKATKQVASGQLSNVNLSVTSTDELGELATAFNGMATDLRHTHEKLIRLSSGDFSQITEEGDDKDDGVEFGELGLAFNGLVENLRQTHQQLIQSGKMAALGQLVAGIAHEINTPAGAIVGAIGEIDKGYLGLLQQLVDLVDHLSIEQKSHYINACKIVLERDKSSSTIEQRRIAREIAAKLKEVGIDNARDSSKTMAVVGLLLEDMDLLLPLLKTEHGSAIQQSLFKIGMNQMHIANIGIAISRIHRMVQALKTYSHSDQTEMTKTNLQDDLENTLILLHNRLKRAITVHQEFEENMPTIVCRADQLNQVWANLINNAIEAMKGEGNITLHLSQKNQGVCVQIQDDGPGIPHDLLARIFEPYFTTKKKGEGTGLGLGICKDIVEGHGGSMKVESQPGSTVFTVWIPFQATNQQESPKTVHDEVSRE